MRVLRWTALVCLVPFAAPFVVMGGVVAVMFAICLCAQPKESS